MLEPKDLIDFELRVANAFNSAKIKAPIHLHGGNEQQLIDIFKDIRGRDWVFSSWSSHYHCLLKGVPLETLFQDILDGKSINLVYPEYNIYTSAIVGGIVPIALGAALASKRLLLDQHVYLFMGEMTSETGAAHEAHKYAVMHHLPITFIIEDNGKSVCTDTYSAWGLQRLTLQGQPKVLAYTYKLPWPHAGAGVRVQF
jgi:TPP-dependent pyruvate/acetoin dehydrogenase alpha subunit